MRDGLVFRRDVYNYWNRMGAIVMASMLYFVYKRGITVQNGDTPAIRGHYGLQVGYRIYSVTYWIDYLGDSRVERNKLVSYYF